MKVDEIRRIAVVGAGLMGSQIGMEFALAGYEVCLNDLTEEKLQQAIKSIQADTQRYMDLGLLTSEQVETALIRIHTSSVLKETVEDADVVVEAVFEDLELKRRVFRMLDPLCPERSILVSNASGLPPSKLASATQRPDKVLVANYWNPTYLIPLVEMIRGEETSDETVETVYHLLIKVGKQPAIENEPGYVGNRLQGALFREVFSIVSKGIATPQDVDTVIKNSFGRRLAFVGPLEYFDTMGWDLILHWYPYMIQEIESSTEVPHVLKEKVEKGELGVKTGKGFYEWTPESAEAYKQRLAQALAEIRNIHQTIDL
jgi:3-hydroxybutyryl-CoA dehydrogenase